MICLLLRTANFFDVIYRKCLSTVNLEERKKQEKHPPPKKNDTKTKETYKLSFFFSLLSCEKLYFLKSKFVYDYCLCEKIWFQRIEISVKGSMYSHVLALDYKFIVEYIHKIIGKAFVVPQF